MFRYLCVAVLAVRLYRRRFAFAFTNDSETEFRWFLRVANTLASEDPLHNSLRPVINRTRAVCRVFF